jgi:hypothetical protein
MSLLCLDVSWVDHFNMQRRNASIFPLSDLRRFELCSYYILLKHEEPGRKSRALNLGDILPGSHDIFIAMGTCSRKYQCDAILISLSALPLKGNQLCCWFGFGTQIRHSQASARLRRITFDYLARNVSTNATCRRGRH